jgi:hypothetical protein
MSGATERDSRVRFAAFSASKPANRALRGAREFPDMPRR